MAGRASQSTARLGKEQAQRARLAKAKLLFPDGRWLWVRAKSHYDACCEAEKSGLAVPHQTRFCAADWPTDETKEVKGWVRI